MVPRLDPYGGCSEPAIVRGAQAQRGPPSCGEGGDFGILMVEAIAGAVLQWMIDEMKKRSQHLKTVHCTRKTR